MRGHLDDHRFGTVLGFIEDERTSVTRTAIMR